MTAAMRRNVRCLCTLASWLAVWPAFLSTAAAGVPEAAIEEPLEAGFQRQWWPSDLREQLIRLLPGETLEGAARTLVEQKVQVRLDRDRAFLQIRIPLG